MANVRSRSSILAIPAIPSPLPLPYPSQIGVDFTGSRPKPSQIGVGFRDSAHIWRRVPDLPHSDQCHPCLSVVRFALPNLGDAVRFLRSHLCAPSCPLWFRFCVGCWAACRASKIQKRNGLSLRTCQPFCCISDVTRFSNHSHSRSSSLAAVMSFAALCLTRVHVFGTRQGQLTANPTRN
jgi:hypothetical protein